MHSADSRFDSPVSSEADAFLTACNLNYNDKQRTLQTTFLEDTVRYDADLERGVITFRKTSGSTVEFTVQVLGSAKRDTRSWEWAWHNPNTQAELSHVSAKVREVGEKFGLPYLTNGFVPIVEERFPWFLCAIGLQVSEAVGAYSCEHGDLEIFLLLFDPRIDESEGSA